MTFLHFTVMSCLVGSHSLDQASQENLGIYIQVTIKLYSFHISCMPFSACTFCFYYSSSSNHHKKGDKTGKLFKHKNKVAWPCR